MEAKQTINRQRLFENALQGIFKTTPEIEQATVKGKSKAVAVFGVFDGDEPEIKKGKLATKPVFEQKM